MDQKKKKRRLIRTIAPVAAGAGISAAGIGALVIGAALFFVIFGPSRNGAPSPAVHALAGDLYGDYTVESVDIWTIDHWDQFDPRHVIGKPAKFGSAMFEDSSGAQPYRILGDGYVALGNMQMKYWWDSGRLYVQGGGARMILRRR